MMHCRHRRASGEFWIAASLSVLAVVGLVLLLWAPWDRPGISAPRPLVFHCAAGMAKPVQEIIHAYKEKYGVEVQDNFAGSGQLLSTMRTGKGDLFLSADQYHMDKAQKEGLVAETIPVGYLEPVLIVKATTQEKLKAQSKPVTGLQDLLRPDLKLALANPELAAIGKMIKDALSEPKIGLWPKLAKELNAGANRVSTVGTVNDVLTAVRTAENTIGIVWRANAKLMDAVVIVESPELKDLKETIRIGILTSAQGEQATAALQFARFLAARDQGLVHFANHHFDVVPDADIWEVTPQIHLAAGAMLKPGIEDVIKAFAQREGVKIDETFAGCGTLVSQMKSIKAGDKPGKFPDAYFACDLEFMEKVQEWFDAAVTISANDVVIIVRKGNPKKLTGLEDLTRQELKIGLGDAEKSALGKITDGLLKMMHLHDKVFSVGWEERITYGEAGHDLVNKVRVGALDAALVYRSNAESNPENLQKHMDVIDLKVGEALAMQPFAIARDSPHKYLMQRLLQAIVAQQSADRFKTLGFRWVYDGK